MMKEIRMANSVFAVIIVLTARHNPVIAAMRMTIVHQKIVTTLHIPAALMMEGMEWETKENAVLLMTIVNQVLIASQIIPSRSLFVPIPLTRRESRFD